MMLGMNAPKAVAKGEYAKAIRKAVHDSIEAIKNGKVPEKKNQKFNFEWRVQIWLDDMKIGAAASVVASFT